MSEVVQFERPTPPAGPAQPPKSIFADDDFLLRQCAEWRAARAQQQKNWAEHEAATMWGTLPDAYIKLDLEPLDRMKEIEGLLATDVGVPRTMLGARQMLGMAVTILAYEDPKGTLAEGPVLEIVRNVVGALEHCKSEMCIGPKPDDQNDD
jgi:hypothetical protein